MARDDKVIIKFDPLPSSLSRSMLPLIYSTSFLQILNPKPVPVELILLGSSNLLKHLNNYSLFSLEMPIPLSYITI